MIGSLPHPLSKGIVAHDTPSGLLGIVLAMAEIYSTKRSSPLEVNGNRETNIFVGFRDKMEEIRIYPDPILRRRATPIKNIDGKIKEMVDRMVDTMYANKGIGLAAPQIGILRQIIVVGLENTWKALINPEIVEGEGESVMEEGCLSLPTIEVPVRRMDKVLIQAWNVDGKEVRFEFSNFPSRVYQHEIDHLNGILIIHHISRLKRELLIKKMLKTLKDS